MLLVTKDGIWPSRRARPTAMYDLLGCPCHSASFESHVERARYSLGLGLQSLESQIFLWDARSTAGGRDLSI